MAQFKPKGAGLLSQHPDLKSVDGAKVLFYEEPYDSEDGRFTNVKLQLPDGTKWLGSISDKSGQNLAEKWGYEMSKWAGRYAIMSVHESMSGKTYVIFHPTDETDPAIRPFSAEDKAVIDAAKAREQQSREGGVDHSEEIPF